MKQDPLAGLHDIHLPPPVSWWPPAPGWWLLLVLVLLTTAALFWWLNRRKKQRSKNKVFSQREMIDQALIELENLASGNGDTDVLAADLSGLLRRVAMRLDVERNDSEQSGQDIAGLSGDAWLQWLDGRWEKDAFSHGAGHQLIDAPYRRDGQAADLANLIHISREWLQAQL